MEKLELSNASLESEKWYHSFAKLFDSSQQC